jgi:hypothetical protein
VSDQPRQTTWLATALVFSGRRDPQWEISDDQAEAFLRGWSSLVAHTGSPTAPSALGYRGCRLQAPDGRSWLAQAGWVTLSAGLGGAVLETRLDPARGLERLLLSTAPAGLLPPGLKLP